MASIFEIERRKNFVEEFTKFFKRLPKGQAPLTKCEQKFE